MAQPYLLGYALCWEFSRCRFSASSGLVPIAKHAVHRRIPGRVLRVCICSSARICQQTRTNRRNLGLRIPTQTTKMEYTASGFSEPIVTILKSIFRTQKKSERTYYDDKNVIFKDGKAEIQLDELLRRTSVPASRLLCEKISLKVNNLQRGDVDLHVAIAFATIVVFLLIIWWFA